MPMPQWRRATLHSNLIEWLLEKSLRDPCFSSHLAVDCAAIVLIGDCYDK